MKPTLGWTMLSREEMRHSERLTSGGQETRDEIGFLLIHQVCFGRLQNTSIESSSSRAHLHIAWCGTVAVS
jgi:hypothetical protein